MPQFSGCQGAAVLLLFAGRALARAPEAEQHRQALGSEGAVPGGRNEVRITLDTHGVANAEARPQAQLLRREVTAEGNIPNESVYGWPSTGGHPPREGPVEEKIKPYNPVIVSHSRTAAEGVLAHVIGTSSEETTAGDNHKASPVTKEEHVGHENEREDKSADKSEDKSADNSEDHSEDLSEDHSEDSSEDKSAPKSVGDNEVEDTMIKIQEGDSKMTQPFWFGVLLATCVSGLFWYIMVCVLVCRFWRSKGDDEIVTVDAPEDSGAPAAEGGDDDTKK